MKLVINNNIPKFINYSTVLTYSIEDIISYKWFNMLNIFSR